MVAVFAFADVLGELDREQGFRFHEAFDGVIDRVDGFNDFVRDGAEAYGEQSASFVLYPFGPADGSADRDITPVEAVGDFFTDGPLVAENVLGLVG